MQAERQYWRRLKRARPSPDDIVTPGPGQESVWDYPRPPRLEPVSEPIRVIFNATTIADTRNALRVIETAGAPVYYLPPQDIRMDLMAPDLGRSFCEWKGTASYWALRVGENTVQQAAWSYPNPDPTFAPLKDYLAFYCAKMDARYVGDEQATPQPGGFYGGWVTSKICGPIKGEPGSEFW